MSEPQRTELQQQPVGAPKLFTPEPSESGSNSVVAWVVAGLVVLLAIAGLLLATHKKASVPGNTVQPLAAYASNLPLSQLAMSESENISGGKYTYIDGHIRNTGDQTVSGITVQVLFRNDVQLPPQIETQSLALIRTHEPYIDIQPVSASPLKPGDDREFRLTFETIPGNWNYQMPEIHVVQVARNRCSPPPRSATRPARKTAPSSSYRPPGIKYAGQTLPLPQRTSGK